MAKEERRITAAQEAHEDDKRQWESTNSELQNRCIELEGRYERKRLDLLVAEAKLLQAEGSANAQLTDLHKQLAEAQYMVSMGEEKINAIPKRHGIWFIGQRVEDMVKTSCNRTTDIKGRQGQSKNAGYWIFQDDRGGNIDSTRRDFLRLVW